MAIDRNHGGDAGRKFSDDSIRRFLLGQLSAAEQPLFEQSLFTDVGLDTRVRLAELDLTDDYAFERLSANDRISFERGFLLVSDRRQKLQVSRVLRERFSAMSAGASEKSTVFERVRSLLRLNRPAWRIAFGVLIFSILLGTAWLVIKEPRIAGQITNRIIPRRLSAPSAPREANHPTNTSVPEHQSTPSPMPVHDQQAAPPEVTNISLAPAVSPPSEMPSFNLPKGNQDVVRLQLTLKPDQTGPYRIELMTIERSSIYSSDALNPGDSRGEIDFDVPARLLKTGDYQIKLSRDREGSPEAIGTYYFRLN
jgi:hypothetical protein